MAAIVHCFVNGGKGVSCPDIPSGREDVETGGIGEGVENFLWILGSAFGTLSAVMGCWARHKRKLGW